MHKHKYAHTKASARLLATYNAFESVAAMECVRQHVDQPHLADQRSRKVMAIHPRHLTARTHECNSGAPLQAVYVVAAWPGAPRPPSSSSSPPPEDDLPAMTSHLKDVTQRYAVVWSSNVSPTPPLIASSTRPGRASHRVTASHPQQKLRLRGTWFESSLASASDALTGPIAVDRDEREDVHMARARLAEAIPSNLEKCRNHPLYVVKKFVKQGEFLHPSDDKSAIGFIMAQGKKHLVFPRHFVHRIGSLQKWYRECRVVREGQAPVRHDPKRDDPAVKVAMFAEWQTEVYVPEAATGGRVPLGPLGRVELWTPGHLPKGTVHLPQAGMDEVAKRLGVHAVPAMTGFEVKKGRSYPVTQGVVVCREFSDALLSAHAELSRAKATERKKREDAQTKKDWLRLVRATITKFKLLREMRKGGGDVAVDDVMFADDGTLFPDADDAPHVHVFTETVDAEMGQTTQTCACGFSTDYEEI